VKRLSAGTATLTATLLSAMLLVAACSGSSKPKPTPLEDIKPQIAGRQVWSQSVGKLGDLLRPVASAASVTVASTDGRVVEFAADTGRELWQGDVGERLSAGVGSDGRFSAVVTVNNELVVLDAGKVLWRTLLASRVVTPPLVAGERVFVLAIDRSIQAFDAIDGRKLWSQQRPGDPLTLLQPGVLVAWKDTLVAGQGPRLAGFDPLRGTLRWVSAVASPRGTNEVERLADLVGPPTRVGSVICARAFQAAVGCVDAERGTLNWNRPVGGSEGVTADEQFVFAADASDRVQAWKLAGGEAVWNSERLLYRGLSTPLVVGRTVVFGDETGLLHFLDRVDGRTLLRLPTDGRPIVAGPIRVGVTLIAVTKGGGVFAFRPE
jgi:outer membrane assembly lipoprotein YfgL